MKLCSVSGCIRKHLAKGLCGTHYRRLKDSGSARASVPVRAIRLEKPKCSIDGCDKSEYTAGVCTKHYQRKRVHGDATTLLRQPNGSGTKNAQGYRLRYSPEKRQRLEHVLIAESVLGRKLPPDAEVHHVDGNPANNAHDNLVICPDHAYHALLHRRQAAYAACGNPSFLKCRLCGKYDAASALYVDANNCHHRECKSAYQRSRRTSPCQAQF